MNKAYFGKAPCIPKVTLDIFFVTIQSERLRSPNTHLVYHGNRYYITWCYLNYKNIERMMIKQIENFKTHNFNSF